MRFFEALQNGFAARHGNRATAVLNNSSLSTLSQNAFPIHETGILVVARCQFAKEEFLGNLGENALFSNTVKAFVPAFPSSLMSRLYKICARPKQR